MASGFPRALYRFRFVRVVLHIGGKVKRSLVIMYPYYELYDTNVDVCFFCRLTKTSYDRENAGGKGRSESRDRREARVTVEVRETRCATRRGSTDSALWQHSFCLSCLSSLRPSLPILLLLALLLGETRSGISYVVGQQRPEWRRP